MVNISTTWGGARETPRGKDRTGRVVWRALVSSSFSRQATYCACDILSWSRHHRMPLSPCNIAGAPSRQARVRLFCLPLLFIVMNAVSAILVVRTTAAFLIAWLRTTQLRYAPAATSVLQRYNVGPFSRGCCPKRRGVHPQLGLGVLLAFFLRDTTDDTRPGEVSESLVSALSMRRPCALNQAQLRPPHSGRPQKPLRKEEILLASHLSAPIRPSWAKPKKVPRVRSVSIGAITRALHGFPQTGVPPV